MWKGVVPAFAGQIVGAQFVWSCVVKNHMKSSLTRFSGLFFGPLNLIFKSFYDG